MMNNNQNSTDELVEMFLENHCLEGDSGLASLRSFIEVSGYPQEKFSGMNIGNPIEDFLKDNPDAIELLIKWAGRELVSNDPALQQNLTALLPPACPDCGYSVETPGKCEDCAELVTEDAGNE